MRIFALIWLLSSFFLVEVLAEEEFGERAFFLGTAKVLTQKVSCKHAPILIETVDVEDLVDAFSKISQCVRDDGRAIAYVSGIGGSAIHAAAFFDLMRTSGLSEKVTFVAFGQIASAANIVWLAADDRVVLPNSAFLLHSTTWNLQDEDLNTRNESAACLIEVKTRIAQLVFPGKDMDKWLVKIMTRNAPGTVMGAQKALEIGWATRIWSYE